MNEDSILKNKPFLRVIIYILIAKDGLYPKKELINLMLKQIGLFVFFALIVTFFFPILMPYVALFFIALLFMQIIYYKSTIRKIEAIRANILFRYKYNCYLTRDEIYFIKKSLSLIHAEHINMLSEKKGLRDLINNK